MKKSISVFVLVFFFLGFKLAQADVIINEVKYSPTTKQWIEIYNDTDNDIDITSYKILDSSVKTGHGIVALEGGSNLIPKHGFGVIAKVPSDFGSVSFPLFKSSLNIKVSSDTVILKNDLEENISSVDIDGSAVDGNSLQLISGEWKIATPTPGEINENSTSSTSATDDGSSSGDSGSGGGSTSESSGSSFTSSSSTIETKSKKVTDQKIKAQITTNMLAYVGIPFKLEGSAFGHQGEQLFNGRYFWNFGDGDFRETRVINTDKFTHTYFYPGEYNVSFEYYPDSFADNPLAIQKIIIKVVVPEVLISSVGNEKDFFVELSNNTNYNVDLSNWFLVSDGKSFKIPKNTILAAKKKMIIPPRITNFSIADKSTLKLMNSESEMVFNYGTPTSKQDLTMAQPPKSPLSGGRSESFSSLDKGRLGGVEDLTASALQSNPSENNSNNSYLPIITSVIFIGASAGAVYFIRRKKVIPQEGDDFEILDE
jgi:hypothetical protein